MNQGQGPSTSSWRHMTVTGQASGSGPVVLRPFTIGGLLDEPFTLFRRDTRLILLITAVVIVPMQVLLAYVQADLFASLQPGQVIDDPLGAQLALLNASGDQGMGFAISTLASLIFLPIVNGLISRLAVSRVLGEDVDGAAVRQAVLPRWGALIGASLLAGLLTYGMILLGVGIGVVWGTVPGVALAVILVVVGIPVGVAAYVLLSVTPVVIVVERLPVVAALRRSAQLVWTRFWAVFAVLLLVLVITGLMAAAIASIPSVVAVFAGGTVAAVSVGFGELLGQMVVTPYMALLAVMIYLDTRVRREGVDVEILADTARGGEQASAR